MDEDEDEDEAEAAAAEGGTLVAVVSLSSPPSANIFLYGSTSIFIAGSSCRQPTRTPPGPERHLDRADRAETGFRKLRKLPPPGSREPIWTRVE